MTNRKMICIRLICSLLCLLWVLAPAVPAVSAQSAEVVLTTVVRSRPGKDSVIIYIEDIRAKKEMPRNWNVHASAELLQKLSEHFGTENIRLV